MIRVAAYCRVSTEETDQMNSLENQKQFFKKYIEKNSDWKFTKLYIDKGISGTSTKKREGFNQMIKDAQLEKLDLIITKEISRFARNTLDSIYYTRKLKSLGIGVFFLNDNINTLDPDAELRLTIMSSIAQEESRKTSNRVKWGQQRRMEQGVVFGNGVYGYYLKNGELTLNNEQAQVIKEIFNLYLEQRMGVTLISKVLEDRGILSPSGNIQWKGPTILRMLKNEKYIGILKQKKEITPDYLSHKKVINNGEEEFVIIENNHEPIVSKEIFYKVQKEIDRRRSVRLDKSKHSNRYAWSGKVICSNCNARFKRKVWNKKSNNPQIVWQCSTNNKYGREKINNQEQKVGCNNKAIKEEVLENAFQEVLSKVIKDKENIALELKKVLRNVIQNTDSDLSKSEKLHTNIDRIEKKKIRLIELFTDDVIDRTQFDKSYSNYINQIEQLSKRIIQFEKRNNKQTTIKQKIIELNNAVDKIAGAKEFSAEVCINLLDKAVINNKKEFLFYIKHCKEVIPYYTS